MFKIALITHYIAAIEIHITEDEFKEDKMKIIQARKLALRQFLQENADLPSDLISLVLFSSGSVHLFSIIFNLILYH